MNAAQPCNSPVGLTWITHDFSGNLTEVDWNICLEIYTVWSKAAVLNLWNATPGATNQIFTLQFRRVAKLQL